MLLINLNNFILTDMLIRAAVHRQLFYFLSIIYSLYYINIILIY